MKKTLLSISLMLLCGATVCASTVDAERVQTKKSSLKRGKSGKKITATARPHLMLDPWYIVNPRTASLLGIKGPVHTVEAITPIYDGQYEAQEGAGVKMTFDPSGRLMVYDYYDFGDAAGFVKYVFEYDDDGLIKAATSEVMEGTQDPCQDDQSVRSDFSYTYQDGKLTEIKEQTRSVWGKPVSWPAVHYKVTYDAEGNLREVSCVEQPKVYIRYDGTKELSAVYGNHQEWIENDGCRSTWNYYVSPDYIEIADLQIMESNCTSPECDAKYERDSYGNWTKCSWTISTDSSVWENGEFRRISYF